MHRTPDRRSMPRGPAAGHLLEIRRVSFLTVNTLGHPLSQLKPAEELDINVTNAHHGRSPSTPHTRHNYRLECRR